MEKETIIKGRAWVLKENDNLISDIDTDQIYHNAHLAETDIKKMGKFALGNLQGWEDFPKKVQAGDIVLAGSNFGAGSSRQHAVDCFTSLGVSLLIAVSFGAIYKRNAINSAFPILTCPSLPDFEVKDGDLLEVDLQNAVIKNTSTGKEIKSQPFSRVQMDIYQAGGIFEFGKLKN